MIAIALTAEYSYFTVKLIIADFNNDNAYFPDLKKTREMQWIISAIFTVMIILMSVSVMFKLRLRFEDFYKEYGCFLWIVFSIQASSMII